jgi:hypothetical protein
MVAIILSNNYIRSFRIFIIHGGNAVKHGKFVSIYFCDSSTNEHFAHAKFAINDMVHCYMGFGANFVAC